MAKLPFQPDTPVAFRAFTNPVWIGYVEGYKTAADHLYEHCIKHHQDTIVYPVVFLYRMHIELSMKQIISLLNQLYGLNLPIERTHPLGKIWVTIEQAILSKRPYMKGTEYNDKINKCIELINKLDNQSTAFRYPPNELVDVDIEHYEQFDLKTYHDILTGASMELDTIASQLQSAIQNGT